MAYMTSHWVFWFGASELGIGAPGSRQRPPWPSMRRASSEDALIPGGWRTRRSYRGPTPRQGRAHAADAPLLRTLYREPGPFVHRPETGPAVVARGVEQSQIHAIRDNLADADPIAVRG